MMRLLLVALLPSLAFCQKVSIEFDEGRDFSDYKSFALVAGTLNSKNPSLNNELVKKKIDEEIRATTRGTGTDGGRQPARI